MIDPGTRLAFSIRGLPAVKCDGHRNVPDGEVYTAPVRDSVEGTIRYNELRLVELEDGNVVSRVIAVGPGNAREAYLD